MARWLPKLNGSDQPRYVQIAEAIRADIENGVLNEGDKLPSQRQIAQSISIDNSTISRGYMEAARRGYVDSYVGRGTFVRATGTVAGPDPRRVSQEVFRTNMPPEPSDPRLIERMQEGVNEVSTNLVSLLRYQSAIGSMHDRSIAADWMHSNGKTAAIDCLAITPGTHVAVIAVLLSLRKPGFRAFCEDITYPGIRALMSTLDIPLTGLPCDAEGILPDALDDALANAPDSAVYMNPTLQNPTTRTIPASRRRDLATILQKHRTPLVEDDAYAFVASNAPETISSLIPDLGWYVAGLSKCLGAGLRLAYAIAPSPEMLGRFVQQIRNTSLMTSPISIALAGSWIESGTAREIQSFIRAEAAARQQIATEILGGYCLEGDPEAHNIWLTLPGGTTRAEVLSRLPTRQIGIVPSDVFTVAGTPAEAFRICLGGPISRKTLRSDLSDLRNAIREEEWIS